MKDKVIDIFNNHTNTNLHNIGVISSENYDEVAEDIVKLFAIPVVSGSTEIKNGRNTCNHQWVELWSGNPDNSEGMECEGEICRLCGSRDYPI